MFEETRKLADIASRGGRVPPIYLYFTFIIPGFAYSFIKSGHFNYVPFVLVSAAIMPLIAATNLFDDYSDFLKGFEKPESPNAKYRRHPIFYYRVKEYYLLKWAVIFSIIYLVFSFWISLRYGLILNLVAFVGFILGYGYTGPPIGYKYLGLGEVGVFFSTIAASEFISVAATGHFYLSSILFFIPFSLLIVLILFIGNFRDNEFDQKAGLNTLAVLLGRRKSEVFSVAIFVLFYLISVALYLLRVYNRFTPVILITIPFAIYLSFRWTRKDSVNYERMAGPYLFGISMLLVALLVL